MMVCRLLLLVWWWISTTAHDAILTAHMTTDGLGIDIASVNTHDAILTAHMTTDGLGIDIASVNTEEKTHVVMERMLKKLPPHFRRHAHADDHQFSPLHRHEVIIEVKNRHLDLLEREVILRATPSPSDPPPFSSFSSSQQLFQQWFSYDEVTAITTVPRLVLIYSSRYHSLPPPSLIHHTLSATPPSPTYTLSVVASLSKGYPSSCYMATRAGRRGRYRYHRHHVHFPPRRLHSRGGTCRYYPTPSHPTLPYPLCLILSTLFCSTLSHINSYLISIILMCLPPPHMILPPLM